MSGEAAFEDALNARGTSEQSPESNRTVAAFVFDDLEANTITAGQGAGIINDVPSCRELIERMAREAKSMLERLNGITSRPTA